MMGLICTLEPAAADTSGTVLSTALTKKSSVPFSSTSVGALAMAKNPGLPSSPTLICTNCPGTLYSLAMSPDWTFRMC